PFAGAAGRRDEASYGSGNGRVYCQGRDTRNSMSTPNAPAQQAGGTPKASTTFLSPNSVFAEPKPGQARRAAGATAASVVFHSLLILVIGLLIARGTVEVVAEPPRPTATLVFLEDAGPGGGGGGSPAPAPPKPIEIPRSTPPTPVPIEVPPPVVARSEEHTSELQS